MISILGRAAEEAPFTSVRPELQSAQQVMKVFARFLFITAVMALVLSMAISILTFSTVDLQRVFPSAWWLHLVCLALMFVIAVAADRAKIPGGFRKLKLWDYALPMAWWLKIIAVAVVGYALLSQFLMPRDAHSNGPGVVNGQKVLESHGRVIRQLSDAEFVRYRNYEIRAFASWWMIFFGIEVLLAAGLVRAIRSTATRARVSFDS